MLDYEEELKKFKPSLEVDDIEEAVYQEDLSDMTDILRRCSVRRNSRKITVELHGVYGENITSVKLLV